MLSIRLPENLEHKLEYLSEQTHRPKSYYVRLALERFLEDEEDYRLAVARLEEKSPRLTIEEMEKKLGLDD